MASVTDIPLSERAAHLRTAIVRPARAVAPHRPAAAPGGGGGDDRPHPDLDRGAGDDRAPRADDAQRDRRHRAGQAADDHPHPRLPGTRGPDRPLAGPDRQAQRPGQRQRRRSRAAAAAAQAQERLPGAAHAGARRGGRGDARAGGGDPRTDAGGRAAVTAALRHSFNSLEVPNYRRYFTGQLISLSGTWMQTVAAIWVILSLTGSGVAVGLTTALQFLPMLLIGAWGGLLADRIPKRRLLMTTQALMAIPALGLFAVTASGVVAPWMVYLAVFAMGSVNAIDNPTRQSFVIEMVGPDRVVNAVSLNSVIVQAARIVGPALAGILIATVGVVPCFAINALTFAAMIVALWRMDPSRLQAAPPAKQ